jgi:hypothetical protein
MQLLRWNQEKLKDHRTGHQDEARLIADKGLDAASHSRASGGWIKMFLTSPLIEQALALKTPRQASMSVMGIYRKGTEPYF